jgi:hypothetical protein
MERGLYNIATATTTTLIDFYKGKGSISSIRLTNAHAATAVTVDLFLEDESSTKCYLLKTDIPGKASVFLENVSFNNSVLALKVTTAGSGLHAATPLSIIIK